MAMLSQSRRRASPDSDDDFVLVSDDDFGTLSSISFSLPRPQKRTKREHSSPPVPDAQFASSLRLSSPTPSLVSQASVSDAAMSTTPSPTKAKLSISLPPAASSDKTTTFAVDKRGIRDQLVVSVIQHLEKTNNAPISAKELSSLFMDTIDAVRNSPKPTVLVSSRLTAYLKRTWSALSPCPLSKFTCDTGARQICYYLTNHPNRPAASLISAESIPGLTDDEDNLPLDMEATMEDLASPMISRMPYDLLRSDSEDELDLLESYANPSGDDREPTTQIADGLLGADADYLDPDSHGFDAGMLFDHFSSFPPLEQAKDTTDRMIYAMPLLEDIETEFHRAACKSWSLREAERQKRLAAAGTTAPSPSPSSLGTATTTTNGAAAVSDSFSGSLSGDGIDWAYSSFEDHFTNPFFDEAHAEAF